MASFLRAVRSRAQRLFFRCDSLPWFHGEETIFLELGLRLDSKKVTRDCLLEDDDFYQLCSVPRIHGKEAGQGG